MSKFDLCAAKRNISMLMKNKGISQQQLSDALGMNQPNISKALNEKEKRFFSIEQICEIAEYLNVSIDALLDRDYSFSYSLSLRDIGRFIVGYMENGDLKSQTVTVTEHYRNVDWNPFTDEPDFDEGQAEVQYSALYFPNHWYPRDGFPDEVDYQARVAEYQDCGNSSRFVPLNTFIHEYENILNLRKENKLSETAYNVIVEGFLSQLAD